MPNDEPPFRLTEAELQARIDRFAAQMLSAEERFKKTGAIEDRAERDQCWIAQRKLLMERARRGEIVEKMEKGQGLA